MGSPCFSHKLESTYYDGGWHELANAVILAAVDDYRTAMRKKLRTDNQTLIDTCEAIMEEVVNFFYSDWFSTLTDADPGAILDELNKNIMEEEQNDELEGSISVSEFLN